MTEETKAGSKLLAEFENFTIKETDTGVWVDRGKYRDPRFIQPAYHTDYNELHRVWQKINQIPYHHYIRNQSQEAQLKIQRIGIVILYGEPIQAFLKIVDFVTWYNSLKPKEESK